MTDQATAAIAVQGKRSVDVNKLDKRLHRLVGCAMHGVRDDVVLVEQLRRDVLVGVELLMQQLAPSAPVRAPLGRSLSDQSENRFPRIVRPDVPEFQR